MRWMLVPYPHYAPALSAPIRAGRDGRCQSCRPRVRRSRTRPAGLVRRRAPTARQPVSAPASSSPSAPPCIIVDGWLPAVIGDRVTAGAGRAGRDACTLGDVRVARRCRVSSVDGGAGGLRALIAPARAGCRPANSWTAARSMPATPRSGFATLRRTSSRWRPTPFAMRQRGAARPRRTTCRRARSIGPTTRRRTSGALLARARRAREGVRRRETAPSGRRRRPRRRCRDLLARARWPPAARE